MTSHCDVVCGLLQVRRRAVWAGEAAAGVAGEPWAILVSARDLHLVRQWQVREHVRVSTLYVL